MGIGTVFSLLETGVVLAFLLLHRTKGSDRFIWAAATAAFMASFSCSGGLLIWPVGLAQLVLQSLRGEPDDRPRPSAVVIWIGVGALVWVFYFLGYQKPPQKWPTGPAYLMHHPVDTVTYLATMIGSPLSSNQRTAQSLGIIMVALSAWAVVRLLRKTTDLEAAAPLLALLAFTLVTAAAACDRRMGQGLPVALASRYCSLTMLGLVALYALLARSALTERRPATLFALAGMTALLLLGTMTNFPCWRDDRRAQKHLDAFVLGTSAVRYADVVSDEAVSSVDPWNPDAVREAIPFLRPTGTVSFIGPFRWVSPPGITAAPGDATWKRSTATQDLSLMCT